MDGQSEGSLVIESEMLNFVCFFKLIYHDLLGIDQQGCKRAVLASRLMFMLIPALLSRGETDTINKQDRQNQTLVDKTRH